MAIDKIKKQVRKDLKDVKSKNALSYANKAIREWRCMYDPLTNELTYGHLHGCIDGFEDIRVIDATGMPSKEEIRKFLSYELTNIGVEFFIENEKLLNWIKSLAAE